MLRQGDDGFRGHVPILAQTLQPPPEDALRHTFACHLRGAELGIAAPLARRVAAAELDELRRVASLVVGGASSSSSSAARADAALIPGVLFVSDFACTSRPTDPHE